MIDSGLYAFQICRASLIDENTTRFAPVRGERTERGAWDEGESLDEGDELVALVSALLGLGAGPVPSDLSYTNIFGCFDIVKGTRECLGRRRPF